MTAPSPAERMRERNDKLRHDELTYLAHSKGLNLYKIGHTSLIAARLSVMRNGCPDIELIKTYPHDRALEHYLHEKFAEMRITGEWFDLGPDAISQVDAQFSQFKKDGPPSRKFLDLMTSGAEVVEEGEVPNHSLKIFDLAGERGWTLNTHASFVIRLAREDALPFFARWDLAVNPETGKKSWRFASARVSNGQKLNYRDVFTYLADPSVIYPEED